MDEIAIMPNHVHGIIVIDDHRRGAAGFSDWQRNIYEHVIRSQDEWERICSYIQGNPARWSADRQHPRYM